MSNISTATPVPLTSLRQHGAEEFARLGYPTTRNEDWRYTSVSAISDTTFVASADRAVSSVPDGAILAPYVFDAQSPLLVFHNGRFAPSLSSLQALPDGVRVMDLARAATDEPELLQKFLG